MNLYKTSLAKSLRRKVCSLLFSCKKFSRKVAKTQSLFAVVFVQKFSRNVAKTLSLFAVVFVQKNPSQSRQDAKFVRCKIVLKEPQRNLAFPKKLSKDYQR